MLEPSVLQMAPNIVDWPLHSVSSYWSIGVIAVIIWLQRCLPCYCWYYPPFFPLLGQIGKACFKEKPSEAAAALPQDVVSADQKAAMEECHMSQWWSSQWVRRSITEVWRAGGGVNKWASIGRCFEFHWQKCTREFKSKHIAMLELFWWVFAWGCLLLEGKLWRFNIRWWKPHWDYNPRWSFCCAWGFKSTIEATARYK